MALLHNFNIYGSLAKNPQRQRMIRSGRKEQIEQYGWLSTQLNLALFVLAKPSRQLSFVSIQDA